MATRQARRAVDLMSEDVLPLGKIAVKIAEHKTVPMTVSKYPLKRKPPSNKRLKEYK